MKLAHSVSVRAALLNLAKREGLIFQFVVIRYLHERLLYRLSVSEYTSMFFLKGGALLYALEGLHTRPTVDIDMLAKHVSNDKEKVKAIFRTICEIGYDADCVVFDSESIVAEDIAENSKYGGVRLFINARFDTVRQRLQVDIGFGDIITPAPVTLIYPTLLDELESPEIKAYSIETVIAEKFQAMIDLGTFNSRMKDFYDVYVLLKHNSINDVQLQEAIIQTFRQRNTACNENHELFSEAFYNDERRQIMWKAFLKKIKTNYDLEFKSVVMTVTAKLFPLYRNIKS